MGDDGSATFTPKCDENSHSYEQRLTIAGRLSDGERQFMLSGRNIEVGVQENIGELLHGISSQNGGTNSVGASGNGR